MCRRICVPAHLGAGLGAVARTDRTHHRFVFFQPRGEVFGRVAQHRRALLEGIAGLLHHALEDWVGGQREQRFVQRDVGHYAGLAIAGVHGLAQVHQGQTHEGLEGVAELQHVGQAGGADAVADRDQSKVGV